MLAKMLAMAGTSQLGKLIPISTSQHANTPTQAETSRKCVGVFFLLVNILH